MLAANGGFISLADALRSHPSVVDRVLDSRSALSALASMSQPEPGSTLISDAPAGSQATNVTEVTTSGAAATSASEASSATQTADAPDSDQTRAAVRAARLFRAALADAFAGLLSDLMRDLAVDVLARELRLGAVDVAAIARRIIAERFVDEPIRLRVASADAATVCELPLVIDDALAPGDAILECRSGSIDARLAIRLAAVLAAHQRC